MKGCFQDRTLLSLYEGEGTQAQRAHLESCEACAKRYERLVRDLELIGQVLREGPPPQVSYTDPYLLYKRWIPVAAALAVGIALTWGAMWALRPAPEVLPEEAGNESVLRFSEQVSAALFPTVTDNPAEMPNLDSSFTYLDAAFGGP